MTSLVPIHEDYKMHLVAFSVALGICASYAALDLAGRIAPTKGRARATRLAAGSAAMGVGIWSMHYVGMLALDIGVPVSYHLPTVALSLFAAILASATALSVATRSDLDAKRRMFGSLFMGSGIGAMHYIGMMAMRSVAAVTYDWRVVALSIVLAVIISEIALRLAFHMRDEHDITMRKIMSAVMMGSAIALTHYTGMWAASFAPSGVEPDLSFSVNLSTLGALSIGATGFLVVAGAVATSFLDRYISLQQSNLNLAKERESYLQTMAETIPEIIWTASPDGSTDFTNHKWLDYSGLTAEQSKGSGWIMAVHPEDREAARSRWEEALREGKPYEIEMRFRDKDGVFRWFLARANPVRDASTRIIEWFGTCTDIENQKNSQQILQAQVVERTRELADANTRLREEQYFRKLADGVPEIIWTADPQGMIDYVNQQLDYAGWKAEEMYGTKWGEAIHPDDLPLAMEKWQASVQSGRPYDVEYRLRAKDDFRWFLARANPIRNEAGEIVKWIGTCTDIESQKQSQKILEEQVLERTMQLADANVLLQQEMAEKDDTRRQLDEQHEKMVKDLEQRSERAAMLAKMGELLQSCISRDEVIAVALSFAPKIFPASRGALFLLNGSRSSAEMAGSWSECQLPDIDFEVTDCWALRTGQLHLVYAGDSTAKCGHTAELKCSTLCVPIIAQGETLGLMHTQAKDNAIRLDPAELSFRLTFAGQIGLSIANIKLRDALRTQSIRDVLTGLYNRRYLEEILEREMRRCARARQHLGIILIDLDHFKNFNDAFGHDAGDAVLRETGLLLTKCIRAEDFVCRYGGEEFVVILPTANLEATLVRAEALRMRMRELTILYQGKSMGMITISAGVAVFPDHGTTSRDVIAAADAALYEAKRNGRDQVAAAAVAHPELETGRVAASSGAGATA
jgi:diguanylate cyclase (GGDEF)-like protein/PAS domain S-box-containing protein